MADLSTRDSKLVQYLNEAYGKEKELETALQAHITMTTRMPYKKRLQQHLTETRRHARELERRVKQLGGEADIVSVDIPEPVARGAGVAVAVGSKALAAVQGPLHALRGTSEPEKMLKNAKAEYADEHEEIATYTAIETLAESVGDGETAKLARAIRREEERMAGFLQRLIPTLTKAVTQAEIPADQRRTTARRRSTRRPAARSSSTRRSASSRSGRGTSRGHGASSRANGGTSRSRSRSRSQA
jgi:ferritin-like metal-binding protein YciE